ncbi:MAG: ATP-binding protein [Betaproteobacteria bacterium]|nr:ATP-binding protein [Betaproteobacteria bacterium]
MERTLSPLIQADLGCKMVFLSGPRQAGKTTLARSLAIAWPDAQVLNWDVADDRRVILRQSWSPKAKLVVFDELHKMKNWKPWLKGVYDGRQEGQAILVTGSARLETFRQSGESLAGRYFAWRLHPITVKEWVATSSATPEAALERLLNRGGFPEPFLADESVDADRWRQLYLEGVIREDILEFSRIGEIRAMRLFVDMLRNRVGSPLSLASLARDLQVSPTTLGRYLEILEALHIVFTVRPFHRNIARALLKEPKVYFFDTGLVNADEGVRFENACATMLLRHAHFLQDSSGRAMSLHYVRDKEGREIDFALCENEEPVGFAECKLSDPTIPPYLASVAERFPAAGANLLVRYLRQPELRGRISVERAADWLATLSA